MAFYYIILLANFYMGVISSMENIKASYETDQKMLVISVKKISYSYQTLLKLRKMMLV